MSKAILVVDDNNLCKMTITNDAGISVNKTLHFDVAVALLNGACQKKTILSESEIELSDIYPVDNMIATLQVKNIPKYNTKWYILLRQPVPVDFEYFNTTFKNVGVPKCLFAVQVTEGRIVRFKIVCFKDRFVTSKTKLCAYPFSNVSPGGDVCLGSNFKAINLPVDEENIFNLMALPEMFFAMPNSEHNYGHNTSGLYYRDLLKELEGVPFKEEWLKESNMTYDTFVRTLNC